MRKLLFSLLAIAVLTTLGITQADGRLLSVTHTMATTAAGWVQGFRADFRHRSTSLATLSEISVKTSATTSEATILEADSSVIDAVDRSLRIVGSDDSAVGRQQSAASETDVWQMSDVEVMDRYLNAAE